MLPQGTLLLRSWEGREIILRRNGRCIISPAGQGTPGYCRKSAAGCCLLLSNTALMPGLELWERGCSICMHLSVHAWDRTCTRLLWGWVSMKLCALCHCARHLTPCSYSCTCFSKMCLFWIGLGRCVSASAFGKLPKWAAWKCFLAAPVAPPWRGPLWVEFFYFIFHVKFLQIIRVGFYTYSARVEIPMSVLPGHPEHPV